MTTITPDNLTTPPAMTTTPATPDTMTANAASGIINGAASSLPADKAAADASTANAGTMLGSLASLQSEDTNKASDTAALNESTGVNQNTNDINDYNAQLAQITANISGLKDQASVIPLQTQNANANNGATDAGVAPQDTGALRNNAIQALQQSAFADQLNAKISGSSLALASAQAKVTQAINLKYAPIESQIADLQNQLALNKQYITDPAEAKVASDQQTILAQNAVDVQNAKDAETNVAAIAGEAAKNGAPASVIQAINATSNQKDAMSAAGSFLADSTALQLEQANLQKVQLENQKARQDAATSGSNTVVQTNPVTGKTTTIPTDIAPYYNTSTNGVDYVDLSSAVGTATEKTALVNEAQAAGLKVILNKNNALDLTNIQDANTKLDSISTIMAGLTQPNFIARDLGGLGLTALSTLAQTDPQKAAAGALQSVGLDILKAMSGVQGFRGNATVVKQVNDHLPTIYDTSAVAQQKVAYIRGLITDREDAIVGKPDGLTSGTAKGSTSDSSYISSTLNTAGTSYQKVIAATPSGQIPVIENSSGSIGYIPSS
jgi:hypothetical protein